MSPVYFLHTDALYTQGAQWVPHGREVQFGLSSFLCPHFAPSEYGSPQCGTSRGIPGHRLSASSTPRRGASHAAGLVAAAQASGPHQKNAPLQRTSYPSGAAPAIVRPRGRLPCTQACHNQAMPALSKPAPAADERRPHDNLKKAAMTSRQGAGAKQLLSVIGLSSVLHAVATADT